MPKYHFKNEVKGYESGYESDEGTLYHAKEVIGTGSYARARIFQAESERKVVLAPKTLQLIDYEEAQAKYKFFKALYPSCNVKLFKGNKEEGYRLILPLLPGKPYYKFKCADRKQQCRMFFCN